MPNETLLAFDLGVKRIGLALGNTLTGSARPLAVMLAGERTARFEQIADFIKAWEPQRLVVGLSLDAQGQEQLMTRRCRNFANQLHARFGLPVELVDERYSSLAADTVSSQFGQDAVAAAIILQSYLDSMATS